MEALISTLIGGLVVIVTSIIGIYGAKKLGIGENQEKLVATLKGIVEAQAIEIKQLREQIYEQSRQIKTLQDLVRDLKETTVSQARELVDLKSYPQPPQKGA